MKISTHVIVQALLTIGSIATMVSGQVPVKYQPLIVGFVSLVQGIVAWINHYYAPSGTVLPPHA
jgi:hypothetical protein